MLHELNSAGEFKPLNGTAFALTPALRESYTAGSAEDLEYVATAEAARASLSAGAYGTPPAYSTSHIARYCRPTGSWRLPGTSI